MNDTNNTPPELKQPIDQQWQTSDAYLKQQAAVAPPAAPAPTGWLDLVIAVSLGMTVFSIGLFLLTAMTPLGGVIAIQPPPDMPRGGTAFPLVGISGLLVILSYSVYTIFGLYRAIKQNKRRSLYITLLVLGIVLVANPIGLIIVAFVILCNLSPCAGT